MSVTKLNPPPIYQRPLRRWELLVLDALAFYEKRPGGATAPMIADYIRPRLGWFGRRFGCQPKVYAVLYALVDRGWLEDERIDQGPVKPGRYVYRVKRHPPTFDAWTETDHDIVQ